MALSLPVPQAGNPSMLLNFTTALTPLQPFSFTHALVDTTLLTKNYTYSGDVILYQGGCLVNGVEDCPTFCQLYDMFHNGSALHNCGVFWRMAELSQSFGVEMEIDPASITVAIQFGLIRSPNDTLTSTLSPSSANLTDDPILSCLHDYCRWEYNQWECRAAGRTSIGPVLPMLNDDRDPNMYDICSGVDGEVDTAIGGAGVYIAYWIQILMALLMIFPSFFAGIWERPLDEERAESERQLSDEDKEWVRSLSDFQETQCIYAILVCVASMLVSYRGRSGSWNLQQISNTYDLIHDTAVAGSLPVTLNLLNMDYSMQASWWLIGLSFSSVVLSGYTALQPFDFQSNALVMNASAPTTFELCGYVNPAMYCLNTSPASEAGYRHGFLIGLVVLSASVLLYILLRRLPYDVDIITLRLRLVILAILYMAGIALYAILLVHAKTYVPDISALTSWDFGQVIAVGIWVQPLRDLAVSAWYLLNISARLRRAGTLIENILVTLFESASTGVLNLLNSSWQHIRALCDKLHGDSQRRRTRYLPITAKDMGLDA